MADAEEIKNSISIPKYFDQIIVPQLGSYYSNFPVDFDARPVACCPLHDEDTPSMRYYPETNTFYCFGCRKGGDIIRLHRLFTERQTGTLPSFKEALDFLYDYFIRGNEAAQGITKVKHLIEEKSLNTDLELAKYSQYTNRIEKMLLIDNTISDKNKKEIWGLMDTTEILISKNKMRALDAVEYITKKIKEII